MRWRVVQLTLLVVGLSVVGSPVAACTCSGTISALRSLEGSAAVFHGVALTGVDIASDFAVDFEVRQVWKGPVGTRITVKTMLEGLCGTVFEPGREYIVYADTKNHFGLFDPGDLETFCWHRTLEFTVEEATALGEPIWTSDTAQSFRRGNVGTLPVT